MPRVTRAKAAELAETLHIDEDAVLDLNEHPDNAENLEHPATLEGLKTATPEPTARSRSPLGEIAPNSAESKSVEEEGKGRKTRKGGRKGKGKKDAGKEEDLGASVTSQAESVGEMKEGGEEVAVSQTAPATSPEDEEASPTPEAEKEEPLPAIAIDTTSSAQDMEIESPPASPIATATPRVIQSLRKETTGKRSTSNKENVEPFATTPIATPSAMRIEETAPATPYDGLEAAAMESPAPSPAAIVPADEVEEAQAVAVEDAAPEVVAETASEAVLPSSPKTENPIEALDELEEAVEKVSQEIPEVVAFPEKKEKQVILSPVQTKAAARSKPAPVVRTTKASQARLSLASGPKVEGPSLGRPRPSATLGRSGSVRQSTVPSAPALGRSSGVRQSTTHAPAPSKRITSTSSNASASRATKPTSPKEVREKKEAVIPHSKPRPISLSFPTPPPPQRSTKPTTKSSFQLPGEAVAAKLKAAREERMNASTTTKPEAASEKTERKPSFKARPAPSTTLKKTPSVRHTAASRARESAINGAAAPAPASGSVGGGGGGLKRSNTLPSSRGPRPLTSAAPSAVTSSKRTAGPRPSTAAATSTRIASTSSAISTSGPAKSTVKGREVFNRAAAAKADAEKEKREKEEAAKKARAEAAERGRQASREWAEKQKLKKAGASKPVVAA